MEARRFFLDTAARSFVSAPDLGPSAGGSSFFEEDVESIELYFLKPTGDSVSPYQYSDYSANTVKFAVGITAPAALQTSWVATSTAITAAITSVTTGGAGVNAVQELTFSGARPSQGGIFFTLPPRAITVSSVSVGVFTAAKHGLFDGQTVALSSFTITAGTFANSTYFVAESTPDTFKISNTLGGTTIPAAVTSGGGTATLPSISTNVINFNALTAASLEAAFVSAGVSLFGQPQIVVSGNYQSGFRFTFTNALGGINFSNIQISSTLAAPPGLAANVSFNTEEVAAILAAGKGGDCVMEVEVSDGTARQTYTQPATISSDIIDTTSPVPLPVGGTTAVLNFTDGSGGTWALTVDANGVVTTTKL